MQAYVAARTQGSEAGDVLLDMSRALLSFNYRDTFVNAFDVSAPAPCMRNIGSGSLRQNASCFASASLPAKR